MAVLGIIFFPSATFATVVAAPLRCQPTFRITGRAGPGGRNGMPGTTIRLTMAQALVRWLTRQST
jgi:hypothetical protein